MITTLNNQNYGENKGKDYFVRICLFVCEFNLMVAVDHLSEQPWLHVWFRVLGGSERQCFMSHSPAWLSLTSKSYWFSWFFWRDQKLVMIHNVPLAWRQSLSYCALDLRHLTDTIMYVMFCYTDLKQPYTVTYHKQCLKKSKLLWQTETATWWTLCRLHLLQLEVSADVIK